VKIVMMWVELLQGSLPRTSASSSFCPCGVRGPKASAPARRAVRRPPRAAPFREFSVDPVVSCKIVARPEAVEDMGPHRGHLSSRGIQEYSLSVMPIFTASRAGEKRSSGSGTGAKRSRASRANFEFHPMSGTRQRFQRPSTFSSPPAAWGPGQTGRRLAVQVEKCVR